MNFVEKVKFHILSYNSIELGESVNTFYSVDWAHFRVSWSEVAAAPAFQSPVSFA